MTDRTDDPQDWMEDEARFAAEEAAAWTDAEAAGRGEEPDLLAVCVRCHAAEGTMELADGTYVCAGCYADQADQTFDRLSGA